MHSIRTTHTMTTTSLARHAMRRSCRRGPALLVSALATVGGLALSSTAFAQGGEGRLASEGSSYPLEIEPHFTFGAENVYGSTGFGGGLRVGVPLVVGHLGDVPQNLALSFGGDILHYDNCYFGSYCSANYLLAPVALQWNVFVAPRVSLFGEAGAFLYKGWFDECAPGDSGCSAPPDFGILPTLAVGGRIHLGPNVALALRLGYPTSTLGVSFL